MTVRESINQLILPSTITKIYYHSLVLHKVECIFIRDTTFQNRKYNELAIKLINHNGITVCSCAIIINAHKKSSE